jgi:hypothetical protein
MKKTYILGLVIGLVGIANVASAATITIDPEKINVIQGEDLVVSFVVSPENGENTYTTRLALEYPKDLLEVKSFTYAPEWIPVVREKYDFDNKEKGLIMKTAGFPKGFNESKVFGTITFSVKGEGTGAIRTKEDSFVLNARNENVLRGYFREISVVAVHDTLGFMKYMASMLALGTGSNAVAGLTILIVLLALYITYKHMTKKEKAEKKEEQFILNI